MSALPSPAEALVIDFEAVPDARDRLFPIEIGVASVSLRVASRFIAPPGEWLPARPSWANHHRFLAMAASEGVAIEEIVGWAVRTLTGRLVLSDAPFIDGPLLDRLLERAGAAGTVPLVDFFPYVQRLAAGRGIDPGTLNRWIAEIDEGRGEAHRAGEDARVRAQLLARILGRTPVPG